MRDVFIATWPDIDDNATIGAADFERSPHGERTGNMKASC